VCVTVALCSAAECACSVQEVVQRGARGWADAPLETREGVCGQRGWAQVGGVEGQPVECLVRAEPGRQLQPLFSRSGLQTTASPTVAYETAGVCMGCLHMAGSTLPL